MTEFEQQINSRKAAIARAINGGFIKMCKRTSVSTQVNYSLTKQSADVYIVGSGETLELKNDIGYIQGALYYKAESSLCVNVSYSYKYISRKEKVYIVTDSGNIRKKRDFGFRFDKDIDNEGWGHPASHIQNHFLGNPRFSYDGEDEIESLKDFLRTIRESYCKENTYELACETLYELG